MNEHLFEPISSVEPETQVNQLDYLKEFLAKNKKKSDFNSFVRKKNKKNKK